MAFFEDLSRLVARELAAARETRDDERLAGIVSDLAEMLGTAIAAITDGNPSGIDALLAGVEEVVATVAVEKAPAMEMIARTFHSNIKGAR
jgi:hypothetical protein